jgi:hypothetical protein
MVTDQLHNQKNKMGILDNLENSWDLDLQFESKPMPATDNMGRESILKDMGPAEPFPSLAVKLFSENVCNDCSCKN